LSERTEAALAAEANIRELDAKVSQQKALIVKLEEDILKVWSCNCLFRIVEFSFIVWKLTSNDDRGLLGKLIG